MHTHPTPCCLAPQARKTPRARTTRLGGPLTTVYDDTERRAAHDARAHTKTNTLRSNYKGGVSADPTI